MLLLQHNFITFVLVVVSLLLVEGMGHIDFSNGNLLFLPLGAAILSYLLFGYGVLPGVALANTLIGYTLWNNWLGNGFAGFSGHVIIGSLAPIVAIQMMKSFGLSEFFEGKLINYRHVVFVVILAAMLNTLGKFSLFYGVLQEDIKVVDFISTYLIGDILGGFVFIYASVKLSTLLEKR